MATLSDYIAALTRDRDDLAANLQEMGVEADNTETFTSLVLKVLQISGGEEEAEMVTLDMAELGVTFGTTGQIVVDSSVTEALVDAAANKAAVYVDGTYSSIPFTMQLTLAGGSEALGTYLFGGAAMISMDAESAQMAYIILILVPSASALVVLSGLYTPSSSGSDTTFVTLTQDDLESVDLSQYDEGTILLVEVS
ncbi:MAG: hypothetical protein LUE31_03025 [Lachnospiraceae bacterium]|nr:hypothetical protein [Lachnospiraceae bacterium]